MRAHFDGAPAQQPPAVILGDEILRPPIGMENFRRLASGVDAILHGRKGPVRHHCDGRHRHSSVPRIRRPSGRADWNRILVLRAVSNFDQQPRGMGAAESLSTSGSAPTALPPSLEAAYSRAHRRKRTAHPLAEIRTTQPWVRINSYPLLEKLLNRCLLARKAIGRCPLRALAPSKMK